MKGRKSAVFTTPGCGGKTSESQLRGQPVDIAARFGVVLGLGRMGARGMPNQRWRSSAGVPALAIFCFSATQVVAGPVPYPDGGAGPAPYTGTYNPQTYTFTAASSGDITAYYAGTVGASDDEYVGLEVNGTLTTAGFGLSNQTSQIGQSFDLGHANAGDTLTIVMYNATIFNQGGAYPYLYSKPSLNFAFDNRTGTWLSGDNHIYATNVFANQIAGVPGGIYVGFDDGNYGCCTGFTYGNDTVVLSNVDLIASGQLPFSPIDTAQPSYLSSGLGTTVAPDFQGGTLQISNSGTISQNFVIEAFAGNTIDPHGFAVTFVGTLTGPGSIAINSTSAGGVVVFSNPGGSTYSGQTVIENGTLRAGADNAFSPNSSIVMGNSSAILDLNGFNETVAGLSGGSASGGNVALGLGNLTINGGGFYGGAISGSGLVSVGSSSTLVLTGASTYTGGTTIQSGSTLQIGSGGLSGSVVGQIADAGNLVFDRSDTVAPDVAISGAGNLTQAGTGTLVLNGLNSISGLTTVSSGALEVGDTAHPAAVLDAHLGGVTVGSAGTLKGHGTINGAVRNTAGGIVAPGGTIGTLTVGSYTQGPNSTLAIEVSPTASSLLNSLGSASLNGTLALTFDSGSYGPHIYKFVAGSPVSGTFSSVTQSGLPSSFIEGVFYEPGNGGVDLVVQPKAAAQGIGAVSTATLDQAQFFAELVYDRQDEAGCKGDDRTVRSNDCLGASVWGHALARGSRTAGSGTVSAATEVDGGLIGGVDRRLSDGSSFGFAVAYSDGSLTENGAAIRSTQSTFFASFYGRKTAGGFQLDGQAFYADARWNQKRTVQGYGVATSHPNGLTAGAVAQIAYPTLGGRMTPYIKVSYANSNRASTTETGSGIGPLAISAVSGSISSTRAEVGFKLGETWRNSDGMTLRPELRMGLSDDLSSNGRDVQARLTLIPNSDFTSAAVRPNQVAGVVSGALRMSVNDRLDLYGDARARISRNQSEGSIGIGGAYKF
jgi:autotransporter-associated beta strand protein